MSNAFPSLALHCLGPPSVRVDGREAPPDVLWRKHLALLTYLALSPDGTRSRSHLLGLLWPESPEDKARRSLNEAVRRLRSALGTERLLTRGDALQLNAAELDVDVRQFETLRAEGQLRALELLRGEFLEGFHVDDAPVFEDWMDAQRAQIRQAATGLLVARAEEQLAVNRYVEARALARRALTFDPFSEPALALGMRSAALEGDSTGALALYHDVTERVAREIGETPSSVLSALAARIRAGSWRHPGTRHADLEPPLIGRREVHAQLFAPLDRHPLKGPVCLVIAGDSGSGRTRLLTACAERLALAGATVATARLLESDHDASWSTLRALMRGGLQHAPGLTGTDHVGLRVLAGIVPELAERIAPLETRDVAQVSDALASCIAAVAEDDPLAVLIDDAQWADGSTLAALRVVWSREQRAALVLVLTLEHGAELSAELRALVGSVGREIPGAVVRLEPLTQDDFAALTETMAPWCAGKEERERLARRVAQESGGNPFLAVTLLHDLGQTNSLRQGLVEWPPAGGTLDTSLPIAVSEVVRSAVAARVARLDEDSTAVLRAASIAGDVLDPLVLTEVSGLLGTRVDAALDRLERERFVVFDGGRYRFTGRLIAAVIESECMQAGGRRRLRERYIAALASRDDIDSQLLRAALLASERAPEAFEAAARVAERALALGAQRTASSAIRTAARAAGADFDRLRVLEALRRRASAEVVAQ
ncbi:MAG TPA: AAA family ATPase [Gemmatimonadales bacterium]|nr:AAA family ATPase [Gemmatimonadales bacterium]